MEYYFSIIISIESRIDNFYNICTYVYMSKEFYFFYRLYPDSLFTKTSYRNSEFKHFFFNYQQITVLCRRGL